MQSAFDRKLRQALVIIDDDDRACDSFGLLPNLWDDSLHTHSHDNDLSGHDV